MLIQKSALLTFFPMCTLPPWPQSYNSSSGGSVSSISSTQKRLDDNGGRFTNANFQEVPSHSSSSSKDGGSSDGKSSDGKSKKSSSHGTSSNSGSRGRKSMPSKPHGPVVTTATSSTAPSSTSPFQQGETLEHVYLNFTSDCWGSELVNTLSVFLNWTSRFKSRVDFLCVTFLVCCDRVGWKPEAVSLACVYDKAVVWLAAAVMWSGKSFRTSSAVGGVCVCVCDSVYVCYEGDLGVRREACSLPFCYQAVMEGLKQRSRLENSD